MPGKVKSILRMHQIEDELKKEAQASKLELIQELANTRIGIPIELVRAYDRAKKRYSNAIVRLHNGICQGCHMAASSGVSLIAKAGKSIHVCEYCSRLIYCDEPIVNPESEKKEK